MRQTAPLVALCLACAIVGALAALLVDSGGGGRLRTDSGEALGEAVAQLTDEVGLLARRIDALRPAPTLSGAAERRAPVRPEAESAPAPHGERSLQSPVRMGSAAMSGADLLVRRDASDPPLSPTNRERVDEVGDLGRWEDNEGLRARWLLVSEASVLAWFGAPDAVYPDGGGERWEYRRLVRGVRRNLSIALHRGRVVRFYP